MKHCKISDMLVIGKEKCRLLGGMSLFFLLSARKSAFWLGLDSYIQLDQNPIEFIEPEPIFNISFLRDYSSFDAINLGLLSFLLCYIMNVTGSTYHTSTGWPLCWPGVKLRKDFTRRIASLSRFLSTERTTFASPTLPVVLSTRNCTTTLPSTLFSAAMGGYTM